MVGQGQRKGKWERPAHRCGVSPRSDENLLSIEWDDSYVTRTIFKTTERYALR